MMIFLTQERLHLLLLGCGIDSAKADELVQAATRESAPAVVNGVPTATMVGDTDPTSEAPDTGIAALRAEFLKLLGEFEHSAMGYAQDVSGHTERRLNDARKALIASVSHNADNGAQVSRNAEAESVPAEHPNLGVHLSHCNFGEHAGCCKYGGEDCPALSDDWSWFGRALQRAESVPAVRLTEDEVSEACSTILLADHQDEWGGYDLAIARAVESKLAAKNGLRLGEL